ncbi:MAG TPA: formate--tetrahydrofolate ligase [Candidatus Latescibacteria bacterium]|nr:formate--tetrahydrofolate ligase [Candidatus Handelsmanbacteria bacterium]HIL07321.1 formate--tetrahydrofolate ligase [Candidatus Latescibacterota bacterium]
MLPDIEIARQTDLLPIDEVATKLGIDNEHLEHYGRTKAKISQDYCQSLAGNDTGKLILVSAINPTPAGEGKTTTTIGLGDALNRIGKRTTVCLREPSLGPCFGMKGGGAGGGHAQIAPMEDINLHFTGDIHAVSTAHNLLAAALDNYIHHGNARGIDPRRITWNRVIDMNDRALRGIVVGLGGTANSLPRESGFDIAVASEVMAILCLSESLSELKERLGKIVVAQTRSRETVRAADLNVHGAMAVLLKDACKPNLVQTLEGNPALVHGGPFANIAHGCNSITATRLAMRLSEYTVTEAGFGADLGVEKFCNIKCRQTGLDPDLVVLVATVRALKYHGGTSLKKIAGPDVTAVEKGIENLKKHIENIRRFGLPAVVAVNTFASDTESEIECIRDKCADLGVEIVPASHHAHGGAGAEDLARTVVSVTENTQSVFKPLYPDDMKLWDKVRTVAQEIYGADDIIGDKLLRGKFRRLEEEGYGHLPVCMAKTQYSLSTDPSLKGRPRGFDVPVRDVKVSAGAGFVVVSTGDIMTMPGLPKTPSAESIDFDDQGQITGLF